MNKTTSIYLDLVRFLAALTVFIVHANYQRFTGGLTIHFTLDVIGNDAVMVFFVLSGFVIAYVANGKENTIESYFLSRFARLYSVVLPALILTVVFDVIGSHLAPIQYDGQWYKTDYPLIRFFSSLFFVNELWFLSIRPFSNGPFWSIGYEFWYYVIFAVLFYLRKPLKYWILGAVCLLLGPKILILLPVWLMGVGVYRLNSSNRVSEGVGWILLAVSVTGYLTYRLNGGQEYILEYTKHLLGPELYDDLNWSRYFLSSYILGSFISLNFIGFSAVSHRLARIFQYVEKPIRYLASYTFVLYLMHYPLLQLFSAITYNEADRTTQPLVVVYGTLFVIWLLGAVTEKQKRNYKRVLSIMWSKAKTLFAAGKAWRAEGED